MFIEASSAFQHGFSTRFRDARPVVIDRNEIAFIPLLDLQPHLGSGELTSVVQQVADAALERQRLAGIGGTRPALNRDAAVVLSQK